jgi:hypothetical protein
MPCESVGKEAVGERVVTRGFKNIPGFEVADPNEQSRIRVSTKIRVGTIVSVRIEIKIRGEVLRCLDLDVAQS